ncbi:bifunctional Major facilitator superfamily/MFS transporter superfamily [Babesia duncani]|uniref:Bifunctional Major facilitator superfamily/MFS transporter superfamily n=1 Tax=Babesia duncani TaxID=323732 RepID=A0AAD9PIR7_9APIC|nr:bifunctional Major facilitator superfamily/MFS transporter superfamily [Babesia duncani]
MFVGPYYDNWTSTEKYFYLCDVCANECDERYSWIPASDTYRCFKQQIAISNLLPVARIAELVSSFFIGVLMDYIGPRITVCLGLVIRGVAYLLLGYLPLNQSAVYISVFLAGFTTNFIFFPALTASLYIPKYRAEVMILIGMSSSFCGFLMKGQMELVLRGLVTNFQVCLVYAFVILICFLIVAVIYMPMKLKIPQVIDDETREPQPKKDWRIEGLLSALSSSKVITCCLYYPVNFAALTILQQSLTICFGNSPLVMQVSEFALPMSFLSCLLVMAVYRVVSPLFIIIAINVLSILAHGLIQVTGAASGITTSILISISYSVCNSKIYNYMETVLDETYFGTIVGLLNTLAGLAICGCLFIDMSPQLVHIPNYVSMAARSFFLIAFGWFMLPGHITKHLKDVLASYMES